MLTIRLQRLGRSKLANYRLVISEKARDTQGNALEILGSYNPHDKEKGLVVKTDRIKYWLGCGAQTSDTVHNLFVKAGLVKADKKKAVFVSKKRAKKLEGKKAAEAKAKADAAAKAAAAAEVQA